MKERLDKLLVDRRLAENLSKAGALIMTGDVLVNDRPVTKAGTPVVVDADIRIKNSCAYVSRAGYKLEAVLDHFALDVNGMVAVDIGASTGGFTDCMLQRGVKKVYAIDVGHSQMHWRLRTDERVECLEGVNARTLTPDFLPEPCDLATFDVSFISLKRVVPPVLGLLRPGAWLAALIKPQFEAAKNQVGEGGIVRDVEVIDSILKDMEQFFIDLGLAVRGIIPSPIKGAKGNQEYLIYAVYGGEA